MTTTTAHPPVATAHGIIRPCEQGNPCRDLLQHSAHPWRSIRETYCPGDFLESLPLADRGLAYAAISRMAARAGVSWSSMANSVAAVMAAEWTPREGTTVLDRPTPFDGPPLVATMPQVWEGGQA